MFSDLQRYRYGYKPKLPDVFSGRLDDIEVIRSGEDCGSGGGTASAGIKDFFKHLSGGQPVFFSKKSGAAVLSPKPLTVAVIFSGGQAPGGHNVISGLFDGLKNNSADSRLLGFTGGPSGLINNTFIEINEPLADRYRNTGGFDMIGSGRTKIETPEQFAAVLDAAAKNKLDAVVIIGGDDSNTNAALLSEYFLEKGSRTQVIGCPKTIDGDLKNEYIETSFGFDTAVKTYSSLIGNIMRDAASARKYWHFIKLMGRAASHIALEAALQTHPNICLISEEIEAEGASLSAITGKICAAVAGRAKNGENFGVVLIPEGLVEFVPEMKKLISEINDIIPAFKKDFDLCGSFEEKAAFMRQHLSPASVIVFESIPSEIANQLLLERDSHGNVQVSLIETEKLLIGMVRERLEKMKTGGSFKGGFSALGHFFGYEGRAAVPSNFDADYCYSLGYNAFALISAGFTGYISCIQNLSGPAFGWKAGGVPLTMMMNMEKRHGEYKPVIKKALVDIKGPPFEAFARERDRWALETDFVYPGSIQYFGPQEICDSSTITLKLEHGAAFAV